jgi:YegS/Rv2252/BmrU family lipid kinase
MGSQETPVPRRLALVVNPCAGGGRARRLLPRVLDRLRADGHDVRCSTTTSLEHCDALVAAALDDQRTVVAMGGDGLVGRAAGEVSRGGGLLAVLPGGRGNDFARAVGLGRDPVSACGVLLSGHEHAVDLGDVGGTAFLGIASVGFDSDVQEIALTTRLPLGPAVYAWGSVRTAATWRHARFSGSIDGAAFEVRGWAVAVANSGVYGGGMRLAPDASLEDGLLDVVTTSATSRTRFLRALPSVFAGTHVRQPSVTVQRARRVELQADRPFRVFADGDPVATLPCTVGVRPGALRVLLPR